MPNSATDNYKGVFDHHLKFGQKPALILIDFAKAYFDSDSPLYAKVEDARSSAIKLRAAA